MALLAFQTRLVARTRPSTALPHNRQGTGEDGSETQNQCSGNGARALQGSWAAGLVACHAQFPTPGFQTGTPGKPTGSPHCLTRIKQAATEVSIPTHFEGCHGPDTGEGYHITVATETPRVGEAGVSGAHYGQTVGALDSVTSEVPSDSVLTEGWNTQLPKLFPQRH